MASSIRTMRYRTASWWHCLYFFYVIWWIAYQQKISVGPWYVVLPPGIIIRGNYWLWFLIVQLFLYLPQHYTISNGRIYYVYFVRVQFLGYA
jgi:hypothetical protein